MSTHGFENCLPGTFYGFTDSQNNEFHPGDSVNLQWGAIDNGETPLNISLGRAGGTLIDDIAVRASFTTTSSLYRLIVNETANCTLEQYSWAIPPNFNTTNPQYQIGLFDATGERGTGGIALFGWKGWSPYLYVREKSPPSTTLSTTASPTTTGVSTSAPTGTGEPGPSRTATSTPSATAGATPPPDNKSGSNSTKIGVGVGVGVGGMVILLLLLAFFLRRRRKAAKVPEVSMPPPMPVPMYVSPPPAPVPDMSMLPAEVPATEIPKKKQHMLYEM